MDPAPAAKKSVSFSTELFRIPDHMPRTFSTTAEQHPWIQLRLRRSQFRSQRSSSGFPTICHAPSQRQPNNIHGSSSGCEEVSFVLNGALQDSRPYATHLLNDSRTTSMDPAPAAKKSVSFSTELFRIPAQMPRTFSTTAASSEVSSNSGSSSFSTPNS